MKLGETPELLLKGADLYLITFQSVHGVDEKSLFGIYTSVKLGIKFCLRAVLLKHSIKFRRTNDLVKLANYLKDNGLELPFTDEEISLLARNVMFQNVDECSKVITEAKKMVKIIREWAGSQIAGK